MANFRIIDPVKFWEIVEDSLGDMETIYMFSERVAKNYGVSKKTVYNSHDGTSMPRFDTAIAIAATLGIPLDRLAGLDKFDNNSKNIGHYQEIDNVLKPLFETIYKAYGVRIRYDIIHSADDVINKNELSKFINNLSHNNNYTSMRLVCERSLDMNNLYPNHYDSSRRSGCHKENTFLVIGGNLYSSGCTPQSDNITSIFDYVNDFCRSKGDGKEFEYISGWLRAYHKERYSLGLLGALSPNKFYWFNYALGYLTKT